MDERSGWYHEDITEYLEAVLNELEDHYMGEKFVASYIKLDAGGYYMTIGPDKFSDGRRVSQVETRAPQKVRYEALNPEFHFGDNKRYIMFTKEEGKTWAFYKNGEPKDWPYTDFMLSNPKPRSYQDARDLIISKAIHDEVYKRRTKPSWEDTSATMTYELWFKHPELISHVTLYYGDPTFYLTDPRISFVLWEDCRSSQAITHIYKKLMMAGFRVELEGGINKAGAEWYSVKLHTAELDAINNHPEYPWEISPISFNGHTMILALVQAFIDHNVQAALAKEEARVI